MTFYVIIFFLSNSVNFYLHVKLVYFHSGQNGADNPGEEKAERGREGTEVGGGGSQARGYYLYLFDIKMS